MRSIWRQPFCARAYAQNAAGEEMVEAIRYAHLHGCRLYMTVNTLFKEKNWTSFVIT